MFVGSLNQESANFFAIGNGLNQDLIILRIGQFWLSLIQNPSDFLLFFCEVRPLKMVYFQ